MNNLEDIGFEEVWDRNGVTYREFRNTLKPVYSITWANILAGFAFIGLMLTVLVYLNTVSTTWSWILLLPCSILTGFAIAFINLFVHEAAHYHLHPSKKMNDVLANIFLCSWVGMHIAVYRKIHWQHHLHLSEPDDSENSYFRPLSFFFLLEALTGIHMVRIMMNRNSSLLNNKMRRQSLMMLGIGLLINLGILAGLIINGYYQAVICWLLGMLVFFPFFAALRQLLEHRNELAFHEKNYYNEQRARLSRLFTNSFFSKIFGSAGFNRHMIHHWDPHLPFTALGEAERFLAESERTSMLLKSSRTTYLAAFKKLWKNRK